MNLNGMYNGYQSSGYGYNQQRPQMGPRQGMNQGYGYDSYSRGNRRQGRDPSHDTQPQHFSSLPQYLQPDQWTNAEATSDGPNRDRGQLRLGSAPVAAGEAAPEVVRQQVQPKPEGGAPDR